MLTRMPEQQDTYSINGVRAKNNRHRSFHFRYLDLCRSKNTAPVAEIRKNNKDQVTLDFFGDKLSVTDWRLISDSIYSDQMLQVMSIRLRKCQGPVLDHVETERKAKLFRQQPVIYTKFIFSSLIDSVSNCIESNKNLRVLSLEGLPLNQNYVECIVKSLSASKSLKEVSFARSNIFDQGCESICNTIKYLENIEKLNLSDTGLTTKGAESIANMIKIQKISRYTEGWQQSLRYHDIDTNNIAGLRTILLARNPQIGDEGFGIIVEVLKDDVWVKVVDMENCGLTDYAANLLLDCLKYNHYLIEFNISGNPGISKFLLRKINHCLKKGEIDFDPRTGEELLRDFNKGLVNSAELAKTTKLSIQQLVDQLKKTNELLELERNLRRKAEEINEKLTAQIKAYEIKLSNMSEDVVPAGYVLVKNESLQSIIRERNELQKLAQGYGDQLSVIGETSSYVKSTPRAKTKNLRIGQGDYGLQFMTPLPEPSVSPTISARSGRTEVLSARQPIKIRKVKSEMKYIEPITKDHSSKRKETKSDYDYATESDVPRFETNIGDTVANKITPQPTINNNNQQQLNARRGVRYASNIQIIKKYELDEISLSTSRSRNSDAQSTESDTLRCTEEVECEAVKIEYKTSKPTTPKEYGQGEGARKRSPRSLFLGLCDK